RYEDVTVDELMQFVTGPDFPTGAKILAGDELKEAYATGRGRVIVRAKAEVEEGVNGRERIVITGVGVVLVIALYMLLGGYVAARFRELNFRPTHSRRGRRALAILRSGSDLARRDGEILVIFAATFFINGAADAFERLFPKRLVELGFPTRPDPIVWFIALGVVTFAVGALALRIVEARINGVDVAQRSYVAACAIGALGIALLAYAPSSALGSAGVVLVSGIGWTVTSAVSTIWVNARATSEVRATLQSFLAQVEYLGEICCGIALSLIAQTTTISGALAGACACVVCAGLIVVRLR
ncbi:hypothetical protein HC891_28140, partial [Candidatus Gracilibacteria bacterium]|nr:hypothetical protein [Candidatus Gracilibacteria bacterium]